MRIIFSIIVTFLFCLIGCKNELIEAEVSKCMETKIEAFKGENNAKAVLTIITGDQTYYWFNTDAVHYDGIEYIYSNDCNQVCFFCGECAFPDCSRDFPYDKSKWKIYWKK